MNEHDQEADMPSLRLVPEPAADAPAASDDAAEVAGASDDDAGGAPGAEDVRDPLLARAEDIADLPLAERPAAFDGLNRALVAELNQLEEG